MKKIFYLFALLVSIQKIYSQDNDDIRIIVGDNHKFAYAVNKNGKWENLTEFIYDDARHFENTNVAWVRYNGKCAIINKQFKLASKLYDDMSIWVEGKLIAVQKDGMYGFIDVQGKEIIPLQYSKAAYVIQDKQFVSVRKNQKWALLDLDNKQVIDFKYNSPIKVEDGYVLTSNDSSRFGIMKLNEQIIIPFVYDQLRITSTKDRFIAQNNKSLYLLNERNKKLFSCTDCDLYAPGYLLAFVVEENKKKGLIDKNGKIIVAPRYDKFLDAKSGYIVYEINRQQGIIDSNGKEVLDRTYNFVELHDNNEAQVFDGEHWKTIQLKIK